MATPRTVWGIDIGQVALKALKLRNVNGELQVEAFDIIEHPKILSQPDADRRQLIRNALEQFLARNDITDSTMVVAVPGQSSFSRFVKLPPVDPKKIPDIVRFEAQQQIPFDINEVQWRYQIFRDPDSPDVEAGIFAVKQVDIDDLMDRFTEVEMKVDVIQMPVMALYNFMTYDNQLASDGATLLVDIGADKTDLVVADGPRMWVRTIQIGGNAFTESLVKALKYPFAKAEKLKRTAVSHKYARQIFQAMRPVFADLAQEIHRSIGAYTATHRETRFKKLIGLGNGFRMPGLQKFLEQNLNLPVVPIDSYNRLVPSATINAPTFTQNVLSFGVAYGLALQGLGETAISTNLLPEKIQEALKWKQRQWWFAGAAACILVALTLPVMGKYKDKSRLATNEPAFAEAGRVLSDGRRDPQWFEQQSGVIVQKQQELAKMLDTLKYREVWPAMQSLILNNLQTQHTQSYLAYCNAPTSDARNNAYKQLMALGVVRDATGNFVANRSGREVVFVTEMTADYYDDLAKAKPQAAAGATPAADNNAAQQPGTPAPDAQKPARGFLVKVKGYTPMEPTPFVNRIYGTGGTGFKQQIEQAAKDLRDTLTGKQLVDIRDVQIIGYGTRETEAGTMMPAAAVPAAGGTTTTATEVIRLPDPLFPREECCKDTTFEIAITVALTVDDPEAAPTTPAQPN